MATENAFLYSPFHPDRRSALAAMERLVLQLRAASTSKVELSTTDVPIKLDLFGKAIPAVGSNQQLKETVEQQTVLTEWHQAAKATTFPVSFLELGEEIPGLESIEDLDLSETDRNYEWVETGSSILRVDKNKLLSFLPAVGVQANLNRKPCDSIFNALQPFVSADLPLFHGRAKDVDEVHTLLKNRSILLLYGEARVGKTSLLQCGLANRVERDAERLLVVRKGNEDLLSSTAMVLREALAETTEGELESNDPLKLAQLLEGQSDRRNILVFDQLEHLFETSIYDEERLSFFQFLRDLVKPESPLIRVVLVLREKFLASIADYEPELPSLLDNRFRLLPLKQGSMIDASVNLLDVLNTQDKLAVNDSEGVAKKICGQLANEKGDVPMHCLQIYMHQLHQKSCKETEPGQPVPMDPDLVDRLGPADVLIDDYLSERISSLEAQLPGADEPPNPALNRELKELKDSKVHCGCKDKNTLVAAAAVAVPPPVNSSYWWWLAPFLLLPFVLLAWWWWTRQQPLPTACQEAIIENSCEAYVNYLCTYGDSTTCSAGMRATLAANNCRVWEDYQQLQILDNCEAYQDFYLKYRNGDICMDRIREKLLDLECPMIRDTVQLTVRDTIIKTQLISGPKTYGNLPGIGTPAAGPEGPACKTIGTTNFKRIGPLWVMTDALAGGPYRWEDALDACVSKGWRLPCVGEIDYLIEKIYRDDPDLAYTMLAGSGECNLVNPLEAETGRIEFWTATEANDASAWTYYFDVGAKTVERQSATPKSARLPCLCVQKDPVQRGSGIPPCYQKQIDRRPSQ
ncbi:ATP-binding protein [Neolewinella persica]|uniref:ATP-binding protein n=1 Tax=Neolewinella persica TaxID=70998 RepID=UPI00146AF3E7|nr:ATP-binding protein [Neolewinella persica]